jgi:hypothetical protein
MELLLTNGEQRYVPMGGATYGYHLDSITLYIEDLYALRGMDDAHLREYLGVLCTRFPPTQE